jgi:O-succinylbenzoate synthase
MTWRHYVLKNGRKGLILQLTTQDGRSSQGEVAPLPGFSLESLADAKLQLQEKRSIILQTHWSLENYAHHLQGYLPSCHFGLESALLDLLNPLPPGPVEISALFMGSYEEILKQADLRESQGFRFAKLKIGSLDLHAARKLILLLQPRFRLRIDVNCALETENALRFFSEFPIDSFDYVEEPFKNPADLPFFPHPLAVDESFPKKLSLDTLEKIPHLKALVYKPTLQGGLSICSPIHHWTQKQRVALVLSSSFESPLGLQGIARMGRRLKIFHPLGLGTCHHSDEGQDFAKGAFHFS